MIRLEVLRCSMYLRVRSHVTRHTSHVTRHTSHVTRHTSHFTRHTSHVTRHTSHVTRQQRETWLSTFLDIERGELSANLVHTRFESKPKSKTQNLNPKSQHPQTQILGSARQALQARHQTLKHRLKMYFYMFSGNSAAACSTPTCSPSSCSLSMC